MPDRIKVIHQSTLADSIKLSQQSRLYQALIIKVSHQSTIAWVNHQSYTSDCMKSHQSTTIADCIAWVTRAPNRLYQRKSTEHQVRLYKGELPEHQVKNYQGSFCSTPKFCKSPKHFAKTQICTSIQCCKSVPQKICIIFPNTEFASWSSSARIHCSVQILNLQVSPISQRSSLFCQIPNLQVGIQCRKDTYHFAKSHHMEVPTVWFSFSWLTKLPAKPVFHFF